MKEDCARSILRLIAVTTILVGVVLTTMTLVALLGASSAMAGVPPGMEVKMSGMVADMGMHVVVAHALIAAWGVVLYLSSPVLARRIVE